MPDTATINDVVQHVLVSAVALGALGVVLRRLVGTFERQRPASSGGIAHGTPGCSHCASGNAVHKKHANR